MESTTRLNDRYHLDPTECESCRAEIIDIAPAGRLTRYGKIDGRIVGSVWNHYHSVRADCENCQSNNTPFPGTIRIYSSTDELAILNGIDVNNEAEMIMVFQQLRADHTC